MNLVKLLSQNKLQQRAQYDIAEQRKRPALQTIARIAVMLFASVAFVMAGASYAMAAVTVAPRPLTQAFANNTATVVLRDIDLTTTEDAGHLMRRLERAVDKVCGGAIARRYHTKRRRYVACYQIAMADAVERINSPKLREVYLQREPLPNRAGRLPRRS